MVTTRACEDCGATLQAPIGDEEFDPGSPFECVADHTHERCIQVLKTRLEFAERQRDAAYTRIAESEAWQAEACGHIAALGERLVRWYERFDKVSVDLESAQARAAELEAKLTSAAAECEARAKAQRVAAALDVKRASDYLHSIGEYTQTRMSELADLFAELRTGWR
jgi:chromosome segregation ATPase